MNHYRPGTPRAALAVAAFAISLTTWAIFVAAPSAVESGTPSSAITEARQVAPPVADVRLRQADRAAFARGHA